jgi:SAM-dependent methyltransferase
MLDVSSYDFWEKSYQAGRTGWDLGTPTPVFEHLLEEKQLPPGCMIVLGAGRGHDARLFAQHGFNVTAVDFALEAVREMERLNDPRAPVQILRADIFELPHELEGTFDYLLEYTCFCAIDPLRRAEYADLVTRLLNPHGIYIDLAFPIDTYAGGPPFAVSIPEILRLFGERNLKLLQRGLRPDSIKPRRGREELLLWQKGA